MTSSRPIRELMTTVVKTVDMTTSVQEAYEIMTETGIRHLPVLDGDRFVGLLSARELDMLRLLPLSGLVISSVSDAMSDEPYVVSPDAQVSEVVREMRANKYGSAVVTEGLKVVGIFTTMDALAIVEQLFE